MYPDERVALFVNEHFVPARVHVKEQADDFARLGDRFNAHWTPTTLLLEPDGTERHRIAISAFISGSLIALKDASARGVERRSP